VPTSQSPLLPRRRLGAELKKLREKARLRLDDVATQLMISSSKLSRLENGQGIPQQRDVRDLINFYKVAGTPLAERLMRWTREGRRQGWWKDYPDVVDELLDAYLAMESEASVMRSFAPTVLPGLLQTETYARAAQGSKTPSLGQGGRSVSPDPSSQKRTSCACRRTTSATRSNR
jgi:transcriptional regulator with XRE-family HTH domain